MSGSVLGMMVSIHMGKHRMASRILLKSVADIYQIFSSKFYGMTPGFTCQSETQAARE